MKHIAKDIYVDRPDQYNFVLVRKGYARDKDGVLKIDDKGNVKKTKSVLGYYSNFSGLWNKVVDLGYEEFVNGDVNACKKLIDEAIGNMKKYIDGHK